MFPNLSRRIAALYKWLGLISIPILTLVTIISISNVFVRGQLATWSWLAFVWAIIFAAAIEVNIVRLFFEAKLDHDTGAFVLGIVLAIVAGAALLIEGLQQSIGFDWSNIVVQWTVGVVVSLRVIVVVLLLAREGSRLASQVVNTEQPIYACMVHFAPPIDTPQERIVVRQVEQIDTPPVPIRMITASKSDTEHRIRTVLKKEPDVSIRKLAEKVGVSPGTATKYKSRIAKEA